MRSAQRPVQSCEHFIMAVPALASMVVACFAWAESERSDIFIQGDALRGRESATWTYEAHRVFGAQSGGAFPEMPTYENDQQRSGAHAERDDHRKFWYHYAS